MAITHNLGYPRIGENRELKFALERYWRNEIDAQALQDIEQTLKVRHWQHQQELDLIPVGDFSLYDQMLDMSVTLGALPTRITETQGSPLDHYFRFARGRAQQQSDCHCVHAGEMVKWFNTNYHYIVPELQAESTFQLNSERLINELTLAKQHQVNAKPVIIGPLTFLALSKTTDQSDPLDLLPKLIPVYSQLLKTLADHGAQWVQIDEPVLATDLEYPWQRAFEATYHQLQSAPVKLLLACYFGELRDNLRLVCELPVAGLHIDAVEGQQEVQRVVDWLPTHKILSLGVINGRNIWKADLTQTVDWLRPFADKLGDRLWLAPSCSLLHVPVDLDREDNLESGLKQSLSFAKQKIGELALLSKALSNPEQVQAALEDNRLTLENRQQSVQLHNPEVRLKVSRLTASDACRQSPFHKRQAVQDERLNLPPLPTTTIGSFPQTPDIRLVRKQFKAGEITNEAYEQRLQQEIRYAIAEQEAIGLDVLVHGEPERNDMVEYFGEQLEGFAFSQFGWVQSYGSRCVKPPILFGDVKRTHAMTVPWTQYAQAQTNKPVKGMLTGPVTILNWSFVREDQPRADTCLQIAIAIREEVHALEQAGTAVIQIDEAALREGLPLRRSDWSTYLDWAVHAFRISANVVRDDTQIHTHMCYSEFNDILPAIAAMDADVITIEASRSNLKLLSAFDAFEYPNAIGPGVYDIHSPNIPSIETIQSLIRQFKKHLPTQTLWVNPDCGLKTRQWEEVKPALRNMVQAVEISRQVLKVPAPEKELVTQ
ncbi:5-methyltetrahydropteroyltriglutamate--homocysteine S-methyltransferase [Reinekea sp. G2M2-21]|uniref:5-methyltetrahydropteroyltriglutamate-- homocysteine S-methyltransferase n=1 Tax=Reinekea sp. G2M2-21 TaxID=2788942 RepID=UPI0018ABA5FF|nr:5-methyltetrahydropteroyltriglutamate--homocysteine S-methyltransferase [Reinekea sp. G2M2-21]